MDLRYPIGKYEPQPYSDELKDQFLQDIQSLPTELESAIQNLDEYQIDTPYREDGWTVKQLVHHIADSHMNGYIRFKLGLTEDNPVIKTYEEKEWAKLPDIDIVPVNVSVTLLHALHRRWHATLENLTEQQWERAVVRPENGNKMTLWYMVGLYVWHGKHHVAHINTLRKNKMWK